MGFRLMKSESATDRLFRATGTGNVFLFNISFCVCGALPCATRGRIFQRGAVAPDAGRRLRKTHSRYRYPRRWRLLTFRRKGLENEKQTDSGREIKTYFLDSAKNLLRAEGLKGVSVRNVAYRAGYSYATLYNYFKDINDLLFRCVEDFCREVAEFVAARTEGVAPGREGLRRTARAYVEYFVEYPGVFELFFLERLGGFGGRP